MDIERPAPRQPIPENAKRVFKGVLFDVYQWEQQLFDGSTATFEKLKRSDTVVVIPVTQEGHIIVLEQEQPGRPPFLSFAGGRVEPGEDPVTAVRRELEEETGYTTGEEPALWYASQPVGKIDWAVYVFIARNCAPTSAQNLDPGEKISLRFVELDQLVNDIGSLYNLDDEVTLRFLKAKHEPSEMEQLKKLFGI